MSTTSATGPLYANGITVTDTFNSSVGGFSACGGSSIVNINVDIDLDNGNSNASGMNSVNTATVSRSLETEYRLIPKHSRFTLDRQLHLGSMLKARGRNICHISFFIFGWKVSYNKFIHF